MRRATHLLLIAGLSGPAWLAAAQPAPAHPCAAVADGAARLACYDRAFPRPAAAAAPALAAPAPAATPAPTAAPATSAEAFGLPPSVAGGELQAIESRVTDDFDGWSPNDRITLANGQVWQVVDGSSGSVGPKQRRVTIRRGSMGAFFMDIEGQNKSPRVRRVQ